MTPARKTTNHRRKKSKKITEMDLPCSLVSRIDIIKIAILPKAIYMFSTIPIKIPMTLSQRLKNQPKVHLETQETVNTQGNTQQKEQCWRHHNTQLQAILQSHSNKNSTVLAQEQI
jgi:hypothetical protein